MFEILKKYVEKLFLLAVLFVISLGVILVLNFENVRLLSKEGITVDDRTNYELEDFHENLKVTITATPNNIFKSSQVVNNREVYFFALKEYIFDFIVISELELKGETTFTCTDVSDSRRDLLTRLINQFNEPLDLEELMPEASMLLNEESKETLLQNTTGRFGDATRLLDCTFTNQRSDLVIYFLITLETLLLFSFLVFIFRYSFLDFIEDLYDETQLK